MQLLHLYCYHQWIITAYIDTSIQSMNLLHQLAQHQYIIYSTCDTEKKTKEVGGGSWKEISTTWFIMYITEMCKDLGHSLISNSCDQLQNLNLYPTKSTVKIYMISLTTTYTEKHLLPTAAWHMRKCRANFSFHAASVYPIAIGTWWMKFCVWAFQAALCISMTCVRSCPRGDEIAQVYVLYQGR